MDKEGQGSPLTWHRQDASSVFLRAEEFVTLAKGNKTQPVEFIEVEWLLLTFAHLLL
jgi:hypothetical protein